ncbi:MAG: class I SAM-dependent methyltransferase [Hyphomonadaceae bacterium]|nr:class I SAM-dependent methyltransferase [Hyphomonadaceae bacterium]
MKLKIDPTEIKGFLAHEEAALLYKMALECAPRGPCLEIGGYCGKSATYIGAACVEADEILFSIDHHRGSEENQPGWEYFDPEVWDEAAGAVDTLPFFRDTIRRAGLEDTVVPVVGRSIDIAKRWHTPLSFLFIDGGHTMEHALNDYRGWTPHLMPGGVLAIHDVFPDPADGGRPPYEIYQRAVASGLFVEEQAVLSLRILRRL